MKQEKEFDRSICFTFYRDFHEQIMDVKRDFGIEQAFEVYKAIVNHGLYGIEPEKGKIRTLTGNTVFDKIEGSQENRAKWFNGENFEQTKLVAEYMRDHPGTSQRIIATATGVGKTKVGKVQKNIRESGFTVQEYLTNVVYPNLNINDNINDNNNNSNNNIVTETATDQRDQSSQSKSQQNQAPPKDNNSFITPDGDATKEKRSISDISDQECQEMFDKYNSGQTMEELMEEYNATRDVINSALKYILLG